MAAKVRALVVDDSGVMRKMVMRSLTQAELADFEFTEAADGVQAFEKFKTEAFEIAFIDWNMPNMTGVDLVREIRRYEAQNGFERIPLVMVTSEKTMGKMQEALDEAGADAYIAKPFTVDDLRAKLQKPIARAQQLADAGGARKPAGAKSGGGFFGRLFG